MSFLRGADDLAQFIAGNYSGRVVEVGAGFAAEVALGLKARGLDVVLTDRSATSLFCPCQIDGYINQRSLDYTKAKS